MPVTIPSAVVLGFVNSAKPLVTKREELHSRDTVKSCLHLGASVQSHRAHHGLVCGSRSEDGAFGVEGCKGKQVKQDQERGEVKARVSESLSPSTQPWNKPSCYGACPGARQDGSTSSLCPSSPICSVAQGGV